MSEDTEVAPEVITEAREMGWIPKEHFKGDPEKWTDAKTYLDRVEHVLPLVKKSRDRLRIELEQTNTKVLTLQQQINEGREAMDAFQKYHEEDTKRRVEAAKVELRRQLVQAKKDGDVEAEVEITEAMAELREPPKVNGEEKNKETKVDPAFQAALETWRADGNQWWGVDQEKTAYAQGQAVYLNLFRKDLKGREFLDEVTKLVQDKFPDKNSRRDNPSKVEGARTGASQQNGGKTYADLPADAKAACDKDASKLVGPTRLYKTAKDWQVQYARDYFAE